MSLSSDIQNLVEMEQIKAQLNPAVLQKVLDLQRNAAALESQREEATKALAAEKSAHQKTAADLGAANVRLSDIAKRETDLAAREKLQTTLELTAKHEAQRVQDHQRMVDLVFRNIETRRTVFTAVPGMRGSEGQYQSAVMPYVQQNDQTERAE